MKTNRKLARDYIVNADRPTFLNTVYKAKVTPRQKTILYKKYLDGYSNVMISMEMSLSIETVRDELQKSYDQISHCLLPAV